MKVAKLDLAHVEGQMVDDYILLAAKIPTLFAKLMERIIRRIWRQKSKAKGYDEDLIKAYGEQLSKAVTKGYGINIIDVDFESKDYQLIQSLQKNVWQFSGAKTYTQLKELSEALYRPDGTLRSFDEFRVQSTIITGKHLRHLRTEYNTAVAGAMMSAKWETIQRQKETYPLLQFIAIEDERTSAICNSLHKVIRPVDDEFWKRFYPPNHFNCRSTVKQLQKGVITPDDKIVYPDIQDIFKVNLGERGLAFPEDHAYFEEMPEEVKKAAEKERKKYLKRLQEEKNKKK